jgi:hypothetical protein
MRHWTLTIALSLILILISNTSLADCQATLAACDAVVEAGKVEIKDLTTQVMNYEQKSALDEQIKSDQQAKLDSPLRDPIKVAAGTAVLVIVLEVLTGHLK